MKTYSREIKDKANNLFENSFNSLSFELLKKALGEDYVNDYIERPSEEVLEKEAKDNFTDEEWDAKGKTEKEETIQSYFNESGHYPMWSTIFEARDDFISDKIMKDIDGLYSLGIGVIAPTDNTNACLFIAGAGYDFYEAHWIPLFIYWDWIDEEEMKDKEERSKIKLTNWNEFGNTLERLAENKDETIKRHATGLLKALKL